MSSQPQAAKLAPELVKNVTNLARTLAAAFRNWTLHPPDHPAGRESSERLAQGIQDAANDAVDLGGYPENTGYRHFNLCTMIVSIVVFDAPAGGVVR